MADVLRIINQLKIEGRGILYTVMKSKGTVLRSGDIYFDLQGNRFRVDGVEMLRRILDESESNSQFAGIIIEGLDHTGLCGSVLVSSLNKMNFLFCNHPLYKNKVDEDYKDEYQAAKAKYTCALFSYEDLEQGRLSLYGEEISGLAIYRGWMMKPDMYKRLYSLLEEKNIILINTPEEYERYHLLPGWYEDFKEYTSDSIWETQGDLASAMNITKDLEGAYIVKDYVKSRKHEWYDACFIRDISDSEYTKNVISNFINRQGDALVGGVVLRKFEDLKQIGYHEQSGMPLAEEYRVFVYAGKVMVVDDYWGEGGQLSISDDEMKWVEMLASKVNSNFVTIDLARREDGMLIVMELGDGQVSGIQQIKPERFYDF